MLVLILDGFVFDMWLVCMIDCFVFVDVVYVDVFIVFGVGW